MNKRKVEVLVAYTRPEFWRAVQRRRIENQINDKQDADYIAFLRTQLRDDKGNAVPSMITHIAKVIEIRIVRVNHDYYVKEMPEALETLSSKGLDKEHFDKEYILNEIEELDKPIPHKKGEPARGQVVFYTTLEELRSAQYIQDIKTVRQLEVKKEQDIYRK